MVHKCLLSKSIVPVLTITFILHVSTIYILYHVSQYLVQHQNLPKQKKFHFFQFQDVNYNGLYRLLIAFLFVATGFQSKNHKRNYIVNRIKFGLQAFLQQIKNKLESEQIVASGTTFNSHENSMERRNISACAAQIPWYMDPHT